MKRLDRWFRREDLTGGPSCPPYLTRWTLLKSKSCSIFVHRFVGDDWSSDLHDHPKRIVSIGLKGRYIEETAAGRRMYRAPWVRVLPAAFAHHITLVDGRPCWTLVFAMRHERTWGFWSDGKWRPWHEYMKDVGGGRSCGD